MTSLRPIPIPISIPTLGACVGVLLACACDRPAATYGAVDQPDPIPQPAAAPPTKAEAEAAAIAEGAPGACTRGTGRNEAGECVELATRKLEHAQQVQIPAGRFIVGDLPPDYDFRKMRTEPRIRWPGQPPRMVSSDGFWIDVHEVTRKAYEACVAAGKCEAPACDPTEALAKLPAESQPSAPQTCVTHAQAQTFCEVQGGRLPTEIEWEYAARGVDARLYPWGSEFRDEFMAGLVSVALPLDDAGYFGVLGQGTNATEWVADTFELDAPLRSYVKGEFRRADGPLLRALGKQPERHIFKSARLGDRYPEQHAAPTLGFRCAADLGPDVVRLVVPAQGSTLPIVREIAPVWLFGGIVEAVAHDEAAAFCAALSFRHEGQLWTDWRLPTLAEVNAIAAGFRGPGPFWSAAEGAIQPEVQDKTPAPTDPWVSLAETWQPGEVAAARCVHDRPAPEPPR